MVVQYILLFLTWSQDCGPATQNMSNSSRFTLKWEKTKYKVSGEQATAKLRTSSSFRRSQELPCWIATTRMRLLYAFRYICYLTNSYNSWKICLKNPLVLLPIYWFYHLPSCFTAYILILPPAKLTLLPANEQSPPATIPSEPPFQCYTT